MTSCKEGLGWIWCTSRGTNDSCTRETEDLESSIISVRTPPKVPTATDILGQKEAGMNMLMAWGPTVRWDACWPMQAFLGHFLGAGSPLLDVQFGHMQSIYDFLSTLPTLTLPQGVSHSVTLETAHLPTWWTSSSQWMWRTCR